MGPGGNALSFPGVAVAVRSLEQTYVLVTEPARADVGQSTSVRPDGPGAVSAKVSPQWLGRTDSRWILDESSSGSGRRSPGCPGMERPRVGVRLWRSAKVRSIPGRHGNSQPCSYGTLHVQTACLNPDPRLHLLRHEQEAPGRSCHRWPNAAIFVRVPSTRSIPGTLSPSGLTRYDLRTPPLPGPAPRVWNASEGEDTPQHAARA